MALVGNTSIPHALMFIKFGLGISVPTVLLLSYHFQCLSHTLLFSTSFQSMYFERRMKANLMKMTAAFGKATYIQQTSIEEHEAALEYRAKALSDTEAGETLIHESIVLAEKSKVDEAQAVAYEDTGEVLGEEAVFEAEEVVLHTSIAAEDEISYDALIAESIAESTLAVRNEEIALDDLAAVSACEFIPLVDILCDVIGGVAEVGLHMKAAEEAFLTGEDYLAATTVKIEEEAEAALATEFELKSAQYASRAGEYEVMAEEEFEEARLEKASAVNMREEGEMELAKSTEENEMATLEEVQADEEEILGRQSLEEGMMHGSRVLIDGGILVISSFLVVSFYGLKFILYTMIPTTFLFFNCVLLPIATQKPVYAKPPNQTTIYYFLEHMSFCILHCSVFISTLLLLSKHITSFYALSPRGKGGLIIIFALNAALRKSIIMQIIHRLKFVRKLHLEEDRNQTNTNIVKSCRTFGGLVYFFIKDFCFFFIIFIIEVLFIWIVFVPNLECGLNISFWYMWTTLLICYLVFHIRFFETLPVKEEIKELPSAELHKLEINQYSKDEDKPLLRQINTKSYMTEDTSMIGNTELFNNESRDIDSKSNKFDFTIHHLRLSLEILITSCMAILLRSTIPQLIKLHPIYLHLWGKLLEHFGGSFNLFCVSALMLCTMVALLLLLSFKI